MSPNKHLGKKGCNCRFHDHKVFNHCESRSVVICLSVSVHVHSHQFCISICYQFCYSLFICCHRLDSCFVFTFVHPLWSFQICFYFFHLIIRCLITRCYFLFWYLKCFPGILIPITTTIRQVNRQDCAILSQYKKWQPITIIDISKITGTNFSNWVRRGWDIFFSPRFNPSAESRDEAKCRPCRGHPHPSGREPLFDGAGAFHGWKWSMGGEYLNFSFKKNLNWPPTHPPPPPRGLCEFKCTLY